LFADGPFVRVQESKNGVWQDLLVEGVPFDDVERLVQVERIDSPIAAFAGQFGWRVEILLSDLVPTTAKLRVVAPPRPEFGGFGVDLPPA
jgi:hypothetical protein